MHTAMRHILSLTVIIGSMQFCANVYMDLIATPGRIHPLSLPCLLWYTSIKVCWLDFAQLGHMWLQSTIPCIQFLTCRGHVICVPISSVFQSEVMQRSWHACSNHSPGNEEHVLLLYNIRVFCYSAYCGPITCFGFHFVIIASFLTRP